MKVLLISAALLAVAVSTLAEAPPASGPYPAASGPYPPSGWKPSGRLLVLPARQQTSTVYGPPPAEYGPPPNEYGPPTTDAATEPAPSDQPTEQPEVGEETPQGDSERLVDSGVYYVLQRDGKLQMVKYSTAPLRSQKQTQQKQQFQGNRFTDASSNFDSQRVQPDRFQQQKQERLTQVQAHQAQFQPQPAQFNQPPAQFNQQSAQFNRQPSQFNQQAAQFNQQSSQFNQQQSQFNQQAAQFNQSPQPFHYVEIQKSQEIQVAQPAPEQPAGGFSANLQYRDVEPISSPIYAYNPNPLVRILKK